MLLASAMYAMWGMQGMPLCVQQHMHHPTVLPGGATPASS